MAKDYTRTVRIRNVGKVASDERGRSVWRGKVEPVELELVSTTALEKILRTAGGKTRTEIRKLASAGKDGVLARETGTGVFRILSERELRQAGAVPGHAASGRPADVKGEPISDETRRRADELSLVSTQILRKVLKPAGAESPKPRAGKKDRFGGFDPYDNG